MCMLLKIVCVFRLKLVERFSMPKLMISVVECVCVELENACCCVLEIDVYIAENCMCVSAETC